MRYHHEKPAFYVSMYGKTHVCSHSVYSRCTLYTFEDKGLAVIQQKFDENTKNTWWEEIDPWLTDIIYLHPKFMSFFEERAGIPDGDIYPTVTIRQIMWALKMKPIPRERWETCFDRRLI